MQGLQSTCESDCLFFGQLLLVLRLFQGMCRFCCHCIGLVKLKLQCLCELQLALGLYCSLLSSLHIDLLANESSTDEMSHFSHCLFLGVPDTAIMEFFKTFEAETFQRLHFGLNMQLLDRFHNLGMQIMLSVGLDSLFVQ